MIVYPLLILESKSALLM